MTLRASLKEVPALARLAGPLIANNLCGIGIVASDALMAGRVGPVDLAGIAVGNSLWIPVFLFAIGHLMAIGPSVAHDFGARSFDAIGRTTRQGLWLALAVSVVVVAVLAGRGRAMAAMGVEPEAAAIAGRYLGMLMFGVPGLMIYQVMRQTAEGTGNTFFVMVIGVLALPLNVALSWALVFGKAGLPAYGAVGCGIGSAATMWLMAVSSVLYTVFSARCQPYALWAHAEGPSPAKLKQLVGVGAPMGIAMAMQTGMFSAVALLVSTLGTTAIAAHQVALNVASIIFMVPLGIAMASTIRVGHALGAGDPQAAQRAARAAMLLSVTGGVVGATLTCAFRESIAGLYTADVAVRALAVQLLAVAALLQLGDSVQIGINGSLRGHKDTRVPMLVLISCYWGIGFTLASFLTFRAGLGPRGAWYGLASCLWVSGGLLYLRLRVTERAAVRRLEGYVDPYPRAEHRQALNG